MVQFLRVAAAQLHNRLYLLHRLCRESALQQFFVHIVQAYLVQLINRHGDIYQLVRLPDHFGYSGKYLAVVDMQANADAEAAIHFFHNLYELPFASERLGTNHVHITLVELTIASFLRTVCTPHGLNLKTLEGKLYLLAVLHHVARKGDSKVVTQPLLGRRIGFLTGVLNTEKQLIAFLTVLAHQRGHVLHSGSLYLLKAIEREHRFDGVEDIIAPSHLHGGEIARTFGNRSHNE